MFHYRVIRGFTLLELMVVIAIISILAAVSAPSFTRQIAKAKLIEVQNLATQHQSLIEEFILIEGTFPTASEFEEIQLTTIDDSLVKSISVNNQNESAGDLHLILNNDTGITEGQYFTYSRSSSRNWTCTSDLDANLLPAQCSSMTEVVK